jgi:hypothetical protein
MPTVESVARRPAARRSMDSKRRPTISRSPPPLFQAALSIALLVALAACGSVRLVSTYDEAIDKGTSEIYTRAVAFVDKVTALAGKPEGTYVANAAFYSDLKASVATLKLRSQAQGKNEITIALVGELATNVENLRRLHESSKDAGLPSILASPALSAIETNCAAIVKFEVAKRRGTQD